MADEVSVPPVLRLGHRGGGALVDASQTGAGRPHKLKFERLGREPWISYWS